MLKNDTRVVSALLVLAVLTFTGWLSARVKKDDRYDRMKAIEDFLDTIYPKLHDEKGVLTFRTEEFHLTYFNRMYVSFVQCRPGSGVPGFGQEVHLPHCGLLLDSGKSKFLHLTVEPGYREFPIPRFSAGGEFVAGEQESLLSRMKLHPEWEEKEILQNLNETKPKFGPADRDSFLKTVPASSIYKFSGCRLNLNGTQFLPRSVEWSVPGTYHRSKAEYSCSAAFEPFEGNLLSIDAV